MDYYDVIVIGAGISGLLSALALAKEGKSVLILEKEDYIGGVCRSYEIDGYRLDTGPHAITRLENGPFKELMDEYFDVVPRFVPFGKYYVRIQDDIKPFPWNINAWLKFSLIPKTDRLLIMKSLFNTLYVLNTGKDSATTPISDILPSNISETSRNFINWLCYFTVGTSIENTPISRFIDNKTNKRDSFSYIGQFYDLLISEGATDQGYPKGGLQSIINAIVTSFPKDKVNLKTGEEVIKIEHSDKIENVITSQNIYECDTIIYSGFASDLPNMVDLPFEHSEHLNSIKKINSLTIWLGLTKKIFENHGSEMWVDTNPFAWVVPTSNYDPSLAPNGNQLVSFAFTLPDEYDVDEMRERAFNTIVEMHPEIENYIDMVHYQELIPEKAAWSINSGFGDVKTPIKNLYCVGTETEKRSAGVSRAAYSVLRCLDTMRSDGNL